MKNSRKGFSLVGLLVVTSIIMSVSVMAQSPDPNNYLYNGTLKLDVGGTFDTANGTLKIGGTKITATAVQINSIQTQVATNATTDATCSNLTVAGAATIAETLGVTGATTLGSTLNVAGAAVITGAVTQVGAATLKSTLNVAGAATITGTVAAVNAATVGGTLGVTGNTTLTGTLTTTGAVTQVGAATLKGTLNVAGASTFTGAVTQVATPVYAMVTVATSAAAASQGLTVTVNGTNYVIDLKLP